MSNIGLRNKIVAFNYSNLYRTTVLWRSTKKYLLKIQVYKLMKLLFKRFNTREKGCIVVPILNTNY